MRTIRKLTNDGKEVEVTIDGSEYIHLNTAKLKCPCCGYETFFNERSIGMLKCPICKTVLDVR